MCPDRNENTPNLSQGTGGEEKSPQSIETSGAELSKAVKLLDETQKVSNVELSAGESAPIRSKSLSVFWRAARLRTKEARRSGDGFDFEALKIFLILTALTVAMALAVRWIV